ncbi:MAG TPA: S-layer homology domain-containing protein [Lachnospiraceae bacterium]|nr:S-layer homology domain-containing protein [Lachnospiraceae bacterium]
MKKILSMLLALCMVITLLPMTALAISPATVTVGGVELVYIDTPVYATTNDSGAVTLGGGEGNYNIKFVNNMLTLKNANIMGIETESAYYGIHSSDNLAIELEGENTVSGGGKEDNKTTYGIYTEGSLTISGSGNLVVSGGNVAKGNSIGIKAQYDLTINLSGSLTALGGSVSSEGRYSCGLYASKLVAIDSGTVVAVGGTTSNLTGSGSYGILVNIVNSDIVVNGGIVTAVGGKANGSVGLYAPNQSSIAVNGGEVTAVGGDSEAGSSGAFSHGGSITVSGGKLVAVGGKSSTESYGLLAQKNGPHIASIVYKGGLLVAKSGKATGASLAISRTVEGDEALASAAVTNNYPSSKYCVISPKTEATPDYHVVVETVDSSTPDEADHIEWSGDDLTLTNTVIIGTGTSPAALMLQPGATLTQTGFNVLLGGEAGTSYGITYAGASIGSGLTIDGDGSLVAIGGTAGNTTAGIRGVTAISGTGNITAIGGSSGNTSSNGILSANLTLSDGSGVAIAGQAGEGGDAWAFSASPIIGDGLATTGASNGKVMTWGPADEPPAPIQNPTPTIQIDYVNEALTGFVPDEQYSINGSASFTISYGEVFPIHSQWMGGSVSIVHKGNGTTTSDSPAQLLSIPVRPAPPTNSDYMVEHETTAGANDGKLKVSIADCEYRSLNHYSGFWLDIPQNEWKENLVPDIYYVRKKAVEGISFASNNSTAIAINAAAVSPAPNLSVADVTLDALTVGYISTTYKSIVITNSGDAQATITSVTTDHPSVFSIHNGSSYVNANSSINSWQIRAATGLAVGTYTATITVTYDGGRTATATVSITVNAVGNHTVTFNPNEGTVSETSRLVAPGAAVGALPIPTRSGSYKFDGWYTTASGGTQISASTTVSANVTYYAHWTYSGGGGSGSGGGSSSNDNSSPVIVTPPAPDKPNSPTQGEIKIPGTVDSKGNVTASITDKTVTDAFDKALAEAKKNGTEQNGITVVLHVDTGNKTGANVTVNLPKTVQDTIIGKKIVNTVVVVDSPNIRIGMDLATVKEINKQAKSDVNITATRMDSRKLTGEAKNTIGNRPVFDLKVNYGSGKAVSSFGSGSVSVTIPYTLGANEKGGNVQAVYVDANGKVQWLTNSVYDSAQKVLRFSTNHFSTYGIGYKQTNTAFTDIAAHWAKEDIEFVVSRGLFSGTSGTTFSPNTAITRGMFVTALGRLANTDVSGYAKSSFSDVKDDAYYMGYIEWASKNNIVNGVGNGKFAPDQSITREQMAVIMSNYAKTIGYTLPKVHVENTFADSAKISAYAKDAVKQMQMAGVISGKNGNLFDPQGTATRAEVSAVLRRFVELAISSDTAQGWTMNDSGKWMYYENGKPVTGKKDIDGGAHSFDQYGVTENAPKNLRYTTYTVQKDDSFWLIAHKLGCTMSELERLNNKIRFYIVHPDDVLRVPEK